MRTEELRSIAGALEPMVSKLDRHVPLDTDDVSALAALPYTVKDLDRYHYIIRERELPTHCCVMLSGYSIRTKIVSDGHRQILGIQMRGDLADFQNSMVEVADHSLQMATPGTVALIPRGEIRRVAFARPNVGQAMWIDTLVEASIAREWIANVGQRNARERLAHLLCEFALRLQLAGLGQDSGYELPMTQQDLADATGMTAVHVNRTIKALEKDRLVDRATPRSIIIGDWGKLADAGDFDSTYLHIRSGVGRPSA